MLEPQQNQSLERVRALARLLDNAIALPGTEFRIGLDPVLGLVPALGDYLGAILSAYIIWQASQLGAPRETLLRMGLNILLETAIGIFPFLGDIFDAAWKANARNVELLEIHLEKPEEITRRDRYFIWLLLGGVALAVILMGALSLAVAYALLDLVGLL